jgi:hypothetical protein
LAQWQWGPDGNKAESLQGAKILQGEVLLDD